MLTGHVEKHTIAHVESGQSRPVFDCHNTCEPVWGPAFGSNLHRSELVLFTGNGK